ncbi:D-sedoheptulose-7-phosphate isomerase [Aminipila sp.]|uniref:D-sedoheptulose-7-phosphate isomerase n=1 Tax=Aminipila sp. TaxID=2060095 RepID=UPI002896A9DC|nr:SIS domain-containing protein [Aminipila sp.]
MKQDSKLIIDSLVNRFPELEICISDISKTIEIILKTIQEGKKILICGNGGSASDSLHIVGELMKSFTKERKLSDKKIEKIKKDFPLDAEYLISNLQEAIPAISLVGETALITAYSNDQTSDLVFAQQIWGLGNKGDLLWAISTSGNSQNILYACKVAKIKEMKVIGLTGKTGTNLRQLSDATIFAPSDVTYKIQEYHLPIYHAICLVLENEVYGD